MNKHAVLRARSPEHCLKLEWWQGPSHVNKVKLYCATLITFDGQRWLEEQFVVHYGPINGVDNTFECLYERPALTTLSTQRLLYRYLSPVLTRH